MGEGRHDPGPVVVLDRADLAARVRASLLVVPAPDVRAVPGGEVPVSWILDTLPFPLMRPCSGPLVWFDSAPVVCDAGYEHNGAILECAVCGSIFTTGNYLDLAHAETPVFRSPL